MRARLALLVALCAASPAARAAPAFDLPALLECRADIDGYVAFRRWISGGGTEVAKAGFAWRRSTVFEGEYGLSHPVTAFGLAVRRLGLTNNGVMAVVDGATPAQVAKRLRLTTLVDDRDMFVANRLVFANDAARAHPGQVQAAPDLDAPGLDALLGGKPSQPMPDVQEVTQVATRVGPRGGTNVGCNYVSTARTTSLPFPQP